MELFNYENIMNVGLVIWLLIGVLAIAKQANLHLDRECENMGVSNEDLEDIKLQTIFNYFMNRKV